MTPDTILLSFMALLVTISVGGVITEYALGAREIKVGKVKGKIISLTTCYLIVEALMHNYLVQVDIDTYMSSPEEIAFTVKHGYWSKDKTCKHKKD